MSVVYVYIYKQYMYILDYSIVYYSVYTILAVFIQIDITEKI